MRGMHPPTSQGGGGMACTITPLRFWEMIFAYLINHNDDNNSNNNNDNNYNKKKKILQVFCGYLVTTR